MNIAEYVKELSHGNWNMRGDDRKHAKMDMDNAYLNSITFQYYLDQLMQIAISTIKYNNLPTSIDPLFIERTLFWQGPVVWFRDTDLSRTGISKQQNEDGNGMLCLPAVLSGKWDVYNNPREYRAMASNGYNKNLDIDNSVIMYNNMTRTPSYQTCVLYAYRLWDLDRAIDANARAQKTPILIQCKNSQRLTMKNLYMKYEGNTPVIFATKDLDPDAIRVLKTDAPYVADKLMALKEQLWNEALTYLGVSNVQYQKRERLVSDEVNRGLGGVMACRNSRIQARRFALDKVNQMFNTNYEVEWNEPEGDTDFNEMIDNAPDEDFEEGGEQNE